jgi:hypothetical protein
LGDEPDPGKAHQITVSLTRLKIASLGDFGERHWAAAGFEGFDDPHGELN